MRSNDTAAASSSLAIASCASERRTLGCWRWPSCASQQRPNDATLLVRISCAKCGFPVCEIAAFSNGNLARNQKLRAPVTSTRELGHHRRSRAAAGSTSGGQAAHAAVATGCPCPFPLAVKGVEAHFTNCGKAGGRPAVTSHLSGKWGCSPLWWPQARCRTCRLRAQVSSPPYAQAGVPASAVCSVHARLLRRGSGCGQGHEVAADPTPIAA